MLNFQRGFPKKPLKCPRTTPFVVSSENFTEDIALAKFLKHKICAEKGWKPEILGGEAIHAWTTMEAIAMYSDIRALKHNARMFP